jgi:hypothetical protein
MSYSFPPVYQNYINLWSPFSRIEPISEVYKEKVEQSEVYKEKVEQSQSVTLYNKQGQLVEYHYGKCDGSKRV